MALYLIGYAIIIGVILALFLFSMMLVKHYVDPSEEYWMSTMTIALSLTLSMLCLCLIPLDVYITSSHTTNVGGLRISKEFINMLFLYNYTAILFFSFVMIPFAYFYGEERTDIYDIDYEPISEGEKFCKAFK